MEEAENIYLKIATRQFNQNITRFSVILSKITDSMTKWEKLAFIIKSFSKKLTHLEINLNSAKVPATHFEFILEALPECIELHSLSLMLKNGKLDDSIVAQLGDLIIFLKKLNNFHLSVVGNKRVTQESLSKLMQISKSKGDYFHFNLEYGEK
eukprot:TRINITY_DN633_c0_g6_i1.p1 TRINITY_DN633_c0_g6~~TRINITY_DN633_c0_g6_i1.p1  ORF type:complete len:153 (-),score=17.69 TRINITY_DN633_c0_g6_i1:71-529(-)